MSFITSTFSKKVKALGYYDLTLNIVTTVVVGCCTILPLRFLGALNVSWALFGFLGTISLIGILWSLVLVKTSKLTGNRFDEKSKMLGQWLASNVILIGLLTYWCTIMLPVWIFYGPCFLLRLVLYARVWEVRNQLRRERQIPCLPTWYPVTSQTARQPSYFPVSTLTARQTTTLNQLTYTPVTMQTERQLSTQHQPTHNPTTPQATHQPPTYNPVTRPTVHQPRTNNQPTFNPVSMPTASQEPTYEQPTYTPVIMQPAPTINQPYHYTVTTPLAYQPPPPTYEQAINQPDYQLPTYEQATKKLDHLSPTFLRIFRPPANYHRVITRAPLHLHSSHRKSGKLSYV